MKKLNAIEEIVNKMDEKSYKAELEKVKIELARAAEVGTILSYIDLGKNLDVEPEYVRAVVGRRFTELTNQIRYTTFDSPDPDFYLLGENIKEISTNGYYLQFKKLIKKKEKGTGLIGRLLQLGG